VRVNTLGLEPLITRVPSLLLGHFYVDPGKIIESFYAHMELGGHQVTREQFEENIAAKLQDDNFSSDIGPLLFTWLLRIAPELSYSPW